MLPPIIAGTTNAFIRACAKRKNSAAIQHSASGWTGEESCAPSGGEGYEAKQNTGRKTSHHDTDGKSPFALGERDGAIGQTRCPICVRKRVLRWSNATQY